MGKNCPLDHYGERADMHFDGILADLKKYTQFIFSFVKYHVVEEISNREKKISLWAIIQRDFLTLADF